MRRQTASDELKDRKGHDDTAARPKQLALFHSEMILLPKAIHSGGLVRWLAQHPDRSEGPWGRADGPLARRYKRILADTDQELE